MQAEPTGRYLRLRRIIDPRTRRTLIVTIDHAVAFGVPAGLESSRRSVANAAIGGADAVLLRPGLRRALADDGSRRLAIMFKLSGRMSGQPDHIQLNSVRHAVRLGADAVCAEIKVGSAGELDSARMIGRIAEEADTYGVPIMVTSYAVPTYIERARGAAYVHACRIAEELGADLIKTSLPDDPDVIRACVEAVQVPLVIAGGPVQPQNSIFDRVRTAVSLGVAGAAVGRAIWSNGDPLATTRELRRIIHNCNVGVDQDASGLLARQAHDGREPNR